MPNGTSGGVGGSEVQTRSLPDTGAPFEAAASRRFLALKKQSINAQVYFVFHRAAKNALSSAAKFKYDDILKIFSADL